jgi:hypothetical protein
LKLALWPRSSIAHDTGLPRSDQAPTGLTLGHNCQRRFKTDPLSDAGVGVKVTHLGAHHISCSWP